MRATHINSSRCHRWRFLADVRVSWIYFANYKIDSFEVLVVIFRKISV